MKPFSLLVKPASADCNLSCSYCFYLDRSALYPESKRHRMSDDVLERMISSYMATDQPQYAFGWQGGEPTLMGVNFFRRVTQCQQKYGRAGALVSNGLQTNATLIDDEFAAHLAEYNFLLGVSLDGPEEIHNRYRTSANGRGSHRDVRRGIECLRRKGVEFNALVLVSSANVKRAKEVYHYLCQMGILYHQYIPCVEFDDNGQPLEFTISGEQWGDFICEIFDEWVNKDTGRVSIRLFDAVVNRMVLGITSVCYMDCNCCQYFVVEYNGDIYPCDFFVEAERKLGNIMNNSWEELQSSPQYLSFGGQKILWNNQCPQCQYLKYCAGDCLKHRLYANNNSQNLGWLCPGWKKFYQHTLSDFQSMASSVQRERELQSPASLGSRYSLSPVL